MKFDLSDILAPPIFALVFLLLGWLYGRSVRQGQPFTPVMKMILGYGFLFVLGLLYSMAFVAMFAWPRPLWIVLTVAWALLLTTIAWWNHRKTKNIAEPEIPTRSVSRTLTHALPVLGLLICLIAGAVEWEYIFEGVGRLWVGLAWLAGAVASILAARQNRRTVVIGVLRGVVALLVIGAIAQRTTPALVAVAVFGLALLLLEKFWRREPNGANRVLGNSAGHS